MTVAHPRTAAPLGVGNAAVLERRVRALLLATLTALLPLALGLAITVAVPKPNLYLLLAAFVGVVGLAVLMISSRLEVTVTVLTVYLGLLDGPVKLLSGGGTATSAVRNVLIFGVAIGAILRLAVKRERFKLPPLSGWVLGFVALVLVEAFNPQTTGVLKFIGGFRQQLQWIPFFFFGYALIRSKARFRKMFIVLGVLALANAAVATYQTRLSPGQIATWGPGYHQRIYGTIVEGQKKGGGRVYVSEGEGRVRPLALGSDSGFGGGMGVIALPGTLALLSLWPPRRRWLVALLCFGAMVGIATSLGRIQLVGGVISALAFALLSTNFGRRMSKPVAVLLGILVLAVPLGAAFIALEGSNTFKRYENLAPSSAVGNKSSARSLLPHEIAHAPFGVGLGTVGAVAGFGGKNTDLLEGHGVSSETQLNFMVDELGAPGLLLWLAFCLRVLVLATRGLWRTEDMDLKLALAAVTAPLVAYFAMGFNGPVSTSAAAGPYIFFASGVIAYWFAGGGRKQALGAEET